MPSFCARKKTNKQGNIHRLRFHKEASLGQIANYIDLKFIRWGNNIDTKANVICIWPLGKRGISLKHPSKTFLGCSWLWVVNNIPCLCFDLGLGLYFFGCAVGRAAAGKAISELPRPESDGAESRSAGKPDFATNSILLCYFFTFKDHCKVRFLKKHIPGWSPL